MKTFSIFILLLSFYLITSNTQDCKDQTFLPTDDYVKITGRYYQTAESLFLVQSGSQIEFLFSGNSLTINMLGDSGCLNIDNQKPRYAIYINDEVHTDTLVKEKQFSINLFENNPQTNTKIKIILLSETMFGAVGIENIITNSCDETPIKPTPKRPISIEFIGDSITCAYGAESEGAAGGFKTMTENFAKSYGYLAAEKLNAECYSCAYSGHTIAHMQESIPPIYEKITKFWEYNYDWNFNLHPMDIVVINLGTNDYTKYVGSDINGAGGQEYVNGYVDFLKVLREKYPSATIIGTVGVLGNEQIYPLIEKAIQIFGDDNVYSYLQTVQNVNEDGVGADYHPSAKTHAKSAEELVNFIKSLNLNIN